MLATLLFLSAQLLPIETQSLTDLPRRVNRGGEIWRIVMRSSRDSSKEQDVEGRFLYLFSWGDRSTIGFEEEFEEWEEFEVIEDSYENFLGESLIGSKDWTSYLQELDPHLEAESIQSNWHILFERHVKKGSVAIDFGAGVGGSVMALASLVGKDGSVVAIENEPELFRGLFWNLIRGKIHNAKIYCRVEEDRIDLLEQENVSLLRIDAKGKEDWILKGAEKMIRRCKPVLIINLIGGIVIEQSDRFIKEEFDRRVGEIQKMGYRVQRIQDSWYLALPLE